MPDRTSEKTVDTGRSIWVQCAPMKKPTRSPRLMVRLSVAERKQLQAAADRAHLPLSTWLRALALREAERAAR